MTCIISNTRRSSCTSKLLAGPSGAVLSIKTPIDKSLPLQSPRPWERVGVRGLFSRGCPERPAMPTCVVIIPSRYASSRFPGKPLVPIAGKPMIQHFDERARQAHLVDAVIVATDDQRILAAVEAGGGQAVLTSPTHPTGTDRIAEVAAQLTCDIVVNVQGDEPGIAPQAIDALVQPLYDDPSLPI